MSKKKLGTRAVRWDNARRVAQDSNIWKRVMQKNEQHKVSPPHNLTSISKRIK